MDVTAIFVGAVREPPLLHELGSLHSLARVCHLDFVKEEATARFASIGLGRVVEHQYEIFARTVSKVEAVSAVINTKSVLKTVLKRSPS